MNEHKSFLKDLVNPVDGVYEPDKKAWAWHKEHSGNKSRAAFASGVLLVLLLIVGPYEFVDYEVGQHATPAQQRSVQLKISRDVAFYKGLISWAFTKAF